MILDRRRVGAKTLEAIGIAAVMVGLIQGVYGSDMWGELYLFLGGMLIFFIGRQLEKHWDRKNARIQEHQQIY